MFETCLKHAETTNSQWYSCSLTYSLTLSSRSEGWSHMESTLNVPHIVRARSHISQDPTMWLKLLWRCRESPTVELQPASSSLAHDSHDQIHVLSGIVEIKWSDALHIFETSAQAYHQKNFCCHTSPFVAIDMCARLARSLQFFRSSIIWQMDT
jgi:hypothetical protein